MLLLVALALIFFSAAGMDLRARRRRARMDRSDAEFNARPAPGINRRSTARYARPSDKDWDNPVLGGAKLVDAEH